jgi:hypothetical protein
MAVFLAPLANLPDAAMGERLETWETVLLPASAAAPVAAEADQWLPFARMHHPILSVAGTMASYPSSLQTSS